MTRLEELENIITRNNNAYWKLAQPVISDLEYDLLIVELKQLDPDHELLSYVGAPDSGVRTKVTHNIPMMSLDKVYTKEDLLTWAKKVARDTAEVFFVNPKFDGISVDYTEGTLSTKKEDVSDKLEYIKNAPVSDVRGEVVVLKSVELPPKYKTTLSAASGILTTSEQKHANLLTFIPFTAEQEECSFAELSEVDWAGTMQDTIEEDFPTDGLVISLKDQEYGETLGGTSHHPLHSIAFKYGNPTGKTKLVSVKWQVGKNKITPVGIVEPVVIDGYTNTRISLHNFDETLRVKIGDNVTIERCGQVIPQLKSVDKTFKSSKVITCPTCPACGAETEYKSPNILCPNSSCGGTLAKRLHDALDRIGVENIGPKIASDLVLSGITNVPAVFGMAKVDWELTPNFAGPSALKMYNHIQAVRLIPIEDFKILAAMNIHGVGISLSKKICASFNLNELPFMDLNRIDGVGLSRASAIGEKFDSGLYYWAVGNLNIIETKGLADRPLVCFTGKNPKPRAYWVKLAEEKGYTYKGAVTKKLSLLVCADLKSTSSKMKKASKYGLNIMTYEEFKEKKK